MQQADEIADWFEAEGPSPENEIPVSEYFLGLLADVSPLGAPHVPEVVGLARNAGASWHQIGEVLSLSAAEAEREFGHGFQPAEAATAQTRRSPQPADAA